ncbi:MAG: hypothetical protein AB9891_06300 [Anaerolineaceae bacterium]
MSMVSEEYITCWRFCTNGRQTGDSVIFFREKELVSEEKEKMTPKSPAPDFSRSGN